VNLVTDTHPLVWYLCDEVRRLGRRGRAAFTAAESGRGTLFVPTAVLLEVVLLEQKGVLKVRYADLRARLAEHPGFQVLPTLPEDVDEVRSLAALVDPFDRLIAATARRLDLPLLTRDERITRARLVRTCW
jgi:PIN domain nuclease of toxin-antitoxin system